MKIEGAIGLECIKREQCVFQKLLNCVSFVCDQSSSASCFVTWTNEIRVHVVSANRSGDLEVGSS